MVAYAMSRITRYRTVGRAAMLMLLLVAVMGPWTYTSDGTLPAEWYRAFNILLGNQRCVSLVSGEEMLTSMVSALASVSTGPVRGRRFFPIGRANSCS